jgi:hypothetical protein
MALGNTLGRTFNFPLPQQEDQGQPQQLLQGEQPQFTPESELSGLYNVRGTTKDVYNKFYKLKNFASSMWKNYGIDVTSTDFTSEFSMKANQLYQESIADLKYTMDGLKNDQRMLERDAAKGNMRLAEGVDLEAGRYKPGQSFVQTGMSDNTKSVLEDYQQLISSKGATEEANKKLDSYKTKLQGDIAKAQRSGRKDLVDLYSRDLQAIQGAIYDSTKDRDRASIDAYRKARADQLEPDYTGMWDVLNGVKNGDISYVEGLVDSKGNRAVTDARVNRTDGTLQGNFLINSKGDRKWDEIPLNDVTGGLLQFVQRFDPNFRKVNYDVLQGHIRKNKPIGEEEDSDIFQTEVAIKNQDHLSSALTDPKNREHTEAIAKLNEFAANNMLIIPKFKGQVTKKGGEKAPIPPGTRILKVAPKKKWWHADNPDTFVITINDGGKVKEIPIKVKENAEFIKELIRKNEVQFDGANDPTQQIEIDPNDI